MTVDRIGERLRRYRRAAKKTLHQVASESGLTASFLSQAERNLTGVSISSLANIAKSLNIPLNALFDQPAQPQPDSHEGERVRYTIEGQPLAYERLSSSFPGNLINAVKMNMPVGYQSELISHEGAEFSYVLSGQIVYTIEGRQYPPRRRRLGALRRDQDPLPGQRRQRCGGSPDHHHHGPVRRPSDALSQSVAHLPILSGKRFRKRNVSRA